VIGIDTSFLVCFELADHPLHAAARAIAEEHRGEGFAVAPQILAEFAHVVTDGRRFERPLQMSEAMTRAERWWNSREVTRIAPDSAAVSLFLGWMQEFSLGRKRLLDSLLAASYRAAGVSLIASTDARDFALFPGVHPLLVR
jgi:predicted nucleic acid-binding protein